MNKKLRNFINYAMGTALCALGICFCTKAGFGLSMLAAPAYIVHVFMHTKFAWFTQGTAEYLVQAVALLVMCLIIRYFKPRYLLSFASSVLSGLLIDAWFLLLGGNGVYESIIARIASFCVGAPLVSLGVAFLFRTEWPVQVFELVVSEISKRYKINTSKVKLFNDMIMLVVSVSLALGLTRALTGIGIGTILVTFLNAPMISGFCKLIDKAEKIAPEVPAEK